MKNVIMIVISIILGALTLGIVLSVSGRMNRKTELQSNLASAVEATVYQMAVGKNYAMNNRKEYIADFIEQLSIVLDTTSDVKVEIPKADMEKGVLSVRVTERYKHPNGKEGSVSCEKTVILNQVSQMQQEPCVVRFYLAKEDIGQEKKCYKSYMIREGDELHEPAEPYVKEKMFDCWKDRNDYIADFSQPVTQNICYYAEWN